MKLVAALVASAVSANAQGVGSKINFEHTTAATCVVQNSGGALTSNCDIATPTVFATAAAVNALHDEVCGLRLTRVDGHSIDESSISMHLTSSSLDPSMKSSADGRCKYHCADNHHDQDDNDKCDICTAPVAGLTFTSAQCSTHANTALTGCTAPSAGEYATAECIAGSTSSTGSNTGIATCTTVVPTGKYLSTACVQGSTTSVGTQSQFSTCHTCKHTNGSPQFMTNVCAAGGPVSVGSQATFANCNNGGATIGQYKIADCTCTAQTQIGQCANLPAFASYTSVGTTANNCEWQCNSEYKRIGDTCELDLKKTYTRWGSRSCPSGHKLVYEGFMAGTHYQHGGAANTLCLTQNSNSPPGATTQDNNGNLLYGKCCAVCLAKQSLYY
jgi:hypothetical protein